MGRLAMYVLAAISVVLADVPSEDSWNRSTEHLTQQASLPQGPYGHSHPAPCSTNLTQNVVYQNATGHRQITKLHFLDLTEDVTIPW